MAKDETITKYIAVWRDMARLDGFDCEGYCSKSQAIKNAPATAKIFPVKISTKEVPDNAF